MGFAWECLEAWILLGEFCPQDVLFVILIDFDSLNLDMVIVNEQICYFFGAL